MPVKLVLATRNPDKLAELVSLLEDSEFELVALGRIAPDLRTVEDGDTLEENARKKGFEAARATGLLALAEDTGLEIDYLDGAPGRFAARFAGEKATYADNVRKVLDLMVQAPAEKRGARFRCVAAVALPDGAVHLFEGVSRGRIAEAPRGNDGFGYDPIFIPEGYDRTFAELGARVKNRVSHRTRAVEKAKKLLIKLKPRIRTDNTD